MVKVMWIVLIVLLIGGLVIARSYNLNLKQSEDRRTFLGKFSIWVVQLGKNAVKTVGYAIKLDWTPETPEPEENDTIEWKEYIIRD